jgi:glycosyltransferase involved in cell wall biosynthesis
MRVLAYFLHNPWPPRSGAHRRCLQVLLGLAREGAEVYLASSPLHSETEWTDASAQALRDAGLKDVFVLRPDRLGRLGDRLQRRWRRFRGVRRWFGEGGFAPWSHRRAFSRLVKRLSPDVVLINYAFNDEIFDHRRHRRPVQAIEMHDLLSVNQQMRVTIARQLEAFEQTGRPGLLFDETLAWAAALPPAPEELAIYRSYNVVLAISRREQELLAPRLPGTRVLWLPMSIAPVEVANRHRGPAIFFASGNPFNRQGLLYFAHCVLPEVLRTCPDFQLDIFGDISPDGLADKPGLQFRGYAPDLKAACEEASFFVCPVFAGTGQQVKIIEAMAHGLPVVALARAATESPLLDSVNGLVATDAGEFARHVCTLWRDRAQCAKLGAAARQAISAASRNQPRLSSLFATGATAASGSSPAP